LDFTGLCYEIKKLKPLDADKIKDNQHVVAANVGDKPASN
jgi:hypothetical protein